MDNFQHGGFQHGGRDVSGDAATGTDDVGVPGYIVGRELGRGGSATVWLVTEEFTHRSFALKCFASRRNSGSEDSIRRELRILSALDHQHLVKAHDVVRLGGAAEGKFGLVMDFAAGGSLAQLLASRGRLTVGETVTVLTPIAQALAYLHHNGFTHSDVSPGNVLFSGQGKPLLADLGVTRMVGEAEAVSDQGTAGFVDPALIDAVRAGLQPERDVFSVAALGWYCLTGTAPLPTADRPPLALLAPGVPPELAAALESGLNDDRRLRPTARDFSTAVYRSAKAVPVDLSVSVHPSIMPELLTRRRHSNADKGGSPLARVRWWERRRHVPRSAPRESLDGFSLPGKHRSPGLAVNGRTMHGRRRPFVRIFVGLALISFIATGAWLWPAAEDRGPEVRTGTADDFRPVAGGNGVAAPDVPAGIRGMLRSGSPEEAVHGLAWVRAAAFSTGSFELLNEINVKGSRAEAADQEIAQRLLESGHVLAGFSTTLSRTEIEAESTAVRAVVGITMVTSAYDEKDSSGSTVAVRPASGEEKLRLVLLQIDGRWRVQEILPVS